MMKKRILSLLLSVALAVPLAAAAPAEESRVAAPAPVPWTEELVLEEELWEEDEPAQVLADDAQPDYIGATEALRRGIAKGEARIYDLAQYHIPANQEGVYKLLHYATYRYGELFVFSSVDQPRKSGGYLSSFAPVYVLEEPDRAAARDFYNKELDAIVAQVPVGASDVEKVLFIHDYLAANYEYDYGFKNYDAYSFLRDGKGVCQAYMLTFSALMDKLGIPVSYVESDILNHAWNVVKLDGKWYHVDATWDDPGIAYKDASGNERIVDVLGAVQHNYFLVGDETNDALRAAQAEASQIQNYEKDFVCGEDYIRGERVVTCTDKTYETGLYADADSPVVYVAGEDSWYYISTDKAAEGGGLYRWTQEGGSVRLETYSRYYGSPAPLVEYEGSLFFADSEKIYRYELDTDTLTTLYENPDSENSPFNGIKVADGTLSYKLRTTGELAPCSEEILPWHDDPVGGAFSYYYNFGAVGLKPGNKGRVFLAWYDPDSGKMTRLELADADGTYGVPVADKDLTCAVFVLKDDGTLVPVQDKFTVHDVPVVPAQ